MRSPSIATTPSATAGATVARLRSHDGADDGEGGVAERRGDAQGVARGGR